MPTNVSSQLYIIASAGATGEALVLGHININSIRNKLDMLADLIKSKVDILLVSETKIDDSFPSAQFKTTGFSIPYTMGRNENGGWHYFVCKGRYSL